MLRTTITPSLNNLETSIFVNFTQSGPSFRAFSALILALLPFLPPFENTHLPP